MVIPDLDSLRKFRVRVHVVIYHPPQTFTTSAHPLA